MVGAELNSEVEHQTAKDSTTGKPMPIGQRGAWAADNVADGDLPLSRLEEAAARVARLRREVSAGSFRGRA